MHIDGCRCRRNGDSADDVTGNEHFDSEQNRAAQPCRHAQLDRVQGELDDTRARIEKFRPFVFAQHARHRWQRPSRRTAEAATTEYDELCGRRDQRERQAGRLRSQAEQIDRHADAAASAADRLPAALEQQRRREEWIAGHPHETTWQQTLRDRISSRTVELGEHARTNPPQHLLRILGSPGVELDSEQWVLAAGKIDAYRERWRLQPHELSTSRFASSTQAQHWRQVDLTVPDHLSARIDRQAAARDHGIELGL